MILDTQRLEAIKQGDTIFVGRKPYGFRQVVVRKVTATQIVLESGCRFRRSDGYEIGTGSSFWHTDFIACPIKVVEANEFAKKKSEQMALWSQLNNALNRVRHYDLPFGDAEMDAAAKLLALLNVERSPT